MLLLELWRKKGLTPEAGERSFSVGHLCEARNVDG